MMEDWQKPYIEVILDHHNAIYGTSIIVKDRCELAYPILNGNVRWDWVCLDKNREVEVAVEVKKLTKEELEERSHLLWAEIGRRLSKSLSGKLPGIFHLSIGMRDKKPELPKKVKEILITYLETEIVRVAPSLEVKGSHDFLMPLHDALGIELPISISKINNSGSKLYPGLTYAWWGSLLADDELLARFKKLIQDANRQLGEAKSRGILETFLIIIAGLYGDADIDELQNKLRELASSNYSNINFCYLVKTISPPIVHELFCHKR